MQIDVFIRRCENGGLREEEEEEKEDVFKRFLKLERDVPTLVGLGSLYHK